LVARLTAVLIGVLALAGCGGEKHDPPLPKTVPIGRGAAHQPPALSAAVRAGRPVRDMLCTTDDPPRYGVHVELFGERQSAVLPAGIGVAPPWKGRRPYVTSGRCSYPLRTREPTGVIEVATAGLTLGDLFTLWGQSLSRTRAGAFRGSVNVYVDGRRWTEDPRAVPLARHAQITIAVGGGVPIHRRYEFPPGL
jgi:hypothetical protein